ncbi:MAG: class I tRNA ligase family protein, partial [Deltaproteobacteria bacterium]|nr:class I tRNA ligase family protein [Deltaproteobacteria bacterium]
ENEIVQSESYTGKPFVKIWIHNEMLSFGKEKMSKSLGNIITIHEFLEKYPSDVLKFILLSNHYRSLLEFSEQVIQESIGSLEKIYKTLLQAQEQLKEKSSGQEIPSKEMKEIVTPLWKKFEEAMDDDFNTAQALGALFEAVRVMNHAFTSRAPWGNEGRKILKEFLEAVRNIGKIWGLFEQAPNDFFEHLRTKLLHRVSVSRQEIEALISERLKAREDKNWKRADEIRKELQKNKILLEDTPTGTTWKVQI